ncbi:hypothetical protein DS901_11510 [Loktanella sp. D2R18]|nr:alpha/beta fold hydrolase [Yoonia sp. 1_MG-2023]MDO6590327.1 alpha/beta hydrolase [Yoonia sp. 1_MG-2023]RBW42870.1 hypothetical protein DS901_11510 [Loktanella sp. D2R18]
MPYVRHVQNTQMPIIEDQIFALDGVALARRKIAAVGPARGTAFLIHGTAQHSLNLAETMRGLAKHGWNVCATDLRGHGHSSGPRAPLGHMEIGAGWEKLVADLILSMKVAFEGVPWEDRLIVAPNIGSPLVLEVLKTWPDLASKIVMIAPPPNQPVIMKLARGISRARAQFNPEDSPDDLTMHQLYSFLGAHLKDRDHLIDVMSSDRAITDALLADPLAWPTPTTGYFYEMFRGIDNAWKRDKTVQLAKGTAFLIMYGSDDPMTASGAFVVPMKKHFAKMGATQVDSLCVEGGRAGMVIDEKRLNISTLISDWCGKTNERNAAISADTSLDMVDVSSDILRRLGHEDLDRTFTPEELVAFCYTHIEDDDRWVEMLYRWTYAMAADTPLSAAQFDSVLKVLMPHMERSYALNKKLMSSAALGAIFQNVIDRFQIGIAVVSANFEVSYANESFFDALVELGNPRPAPDDLNALTRIAQTYCDASFRAACRKGSGEQLLVVDAEAVGFHFRPAALRQAALERGGPAAVLILRPSGHDMDNSNRAELLQLAYGLTRKESLAAVGILDGLSPDAISTLLGVSIHTIRTHLKHIYEKVGVKGQTDLVARLLKGPLGLIARR